MIREWSYRRSRASQNDKTGKAGSAGEIGNWMVTHAQDDPIVVILDDFAGTGATLRSGLLRFRAQIDSHVWNEYMANGRISVFLMYCFPEAIDQIRNAVCGIHVVAANTLSVELRTCSEQAEILESPGDLRFARDVLLQAFSFSSVRT